MENFSAITLRARKREIENTKRLLIRSRDALTDQGGEYAEHHQHVINVLNELQGVVDRGITESESIGKGA